MTEELLEWCAEALGAIQVVADSSREHPGQRSAAHRLSYGAGFCYVKTHRDPLHWHNEVHGYEQWAAAFGEFAPRLLAVRDKEPLALIVSELPGRILDDLRLSPAQEQALWQRAGQALAALHSLTSGSFFGACQRDGTPTGKASRNAEEYEEYIERELESWLERDARIDCLTADELAIVASARQLLPAFAGEHPVPCHRDYGPANWLVSDGGEWVGVIDFEFAQWDVRMADFTRYPNWEWIGRPDLLEAFHGGYARAFSEAEEAQRLVCHIHYALAAVVWGQESGYYGFAAQGREALARLAHTLQRM